MSEGWIDPGGELTPAELDELLDAIAEADADEDTSMDALR